MPSASSAPPASRVRSLDADRYRVLERRDVRRAVEVELVFVPTVIAAELVLLGGTSAVFTIAGASALVAFGVLAVGWLRLGLRRRAHATAFATGVVIFAMGIAGATTTDTIATLMNGMFGVVVIGCAVWMPWGPRWHTAFLVLAAVTLLVGLPLSPIPSLQVGTGLVVGASAVVTSAVGLWLVRRRHLQVWSQSLELRRQKAALGRTIRELETAQRRVQRLEGILPICASCKRIRDGETWQPVERYVSTRSDAEFSHGICPECALRLYPEFAADLEPS